MFILTQKMLHESYILKKQDWLLEWRLIELMDNNKFECLTLFADVYHTILFGLKRKYALHQTISNLCNMVENWIAGKLLKWDQSKSSMHTAASLGLDCCERLQSKMIRFFPKVSTHIHRHTHTHWLTHLRRMTYTHTHTHTHLSAAIN